MDACAGNEGGLVGQVETVQHVSSCAAVTIAALLLAWTRVDKSCSLCLLQLNILSFFFFLHIPLVHFIVMSRVAQDPPRCLSFHPSNKMNMNRDHPATQRGTQSLIKILASLWCKLCLKSLELSCLIVWIESVVGISRVIF